MTLLIFVLSVKIFKEGKGHNPISFSLSRIILGVLWKIDEERFEAGKKDG